MLPIPSMFKGYTYQHGHKSFLGSFARELMQTSGREFNQNKNDFHIILSNALIRKIYSCQTRVTVHVSCSHVVYRSSLNFCLVEFDTVFLQYKHVRCHSQSFHFLGPERLLIFLRVSIPFCWRKEYLHVHFYSVFFRYFLNR